MERYADLVRQGYDSRNHAGPIVIDDSESDEAETPAEEEKDWEISEIWTEDKSCDDDPRVAEPSAHVSRNKGPRGAALPEPDVSLIVSQAWANINRIDPTEGAAPHAGRADRVRELASVFSSIGFALKRIASGIEQDSSSEEARRAFDEADTILDLL